MRILLVLAVGLFYGASWVIALQGDRSETFCLKGHKTKVTALAFSPCNKFLASASLDSGQVRPARLNRLQKVKDVPEKKCRKLGVFS
jgi:hypothetical protein